MCAASQEPPVAAVVSLWCGYVCYPCACCVPVSTLWGHNNYYVLGTCYTLCLAESCWSKLLLYKHCTEYQDCKCHQNSLRVPTDIIFAVWVHSLYLGVNWFQLLTRIKKKNIKYVRSTLKLQDSGKCCCFVRKPSWKSHTNLN